MRPILSVIIAGRNDNYNIDNIYRIDTAINHTASQLERLDATAKVEIILVDFQGDTPLYKELSLSSLGAQISRSILVRDSKLLENNRDFDSATAINIGVRRSKGQFVAVQGLDLMMPYFGWKNLLHILEDQTDLFRKLQGSLMLTPRRKIPYSICARRPDVKQWDQWLMCHAHTICYMEAHPYIGSGMGSLILNRKLYEQLGGLDERFKKWGFTDNDFVLRASRLTAVIDLGVHGIVHYKPDYSPGGKRQSLLSDPLAYNPHWTNVNIMANDEKWGNAGVEYEEVLHREHKNLKVNCKLRSVDEYLLDDDEKNKENWKKRLADPSLNEVILNAVRPTKELPLYQYEMLQALAWICLQRFPKSVAIVGCDHNLYSLNLVAIAAPACEIRVYEHTEQSRIGVAANLVDAGGARITGLGFSGHLRPLVGDIKQTIVMISDSWLTTTGPELVVVNCDSFWNQMEVVLEYIAALQNQTTLILINSASKDRLQAIHQYFSKDYNIADYVGEQLLLAQRNGS